MEADQAQPHPPDHRICGSHKLAEDCSRAQQCQSPIWAPKELSQNTTARMGEPLGCELDKPLLQLGLHLSASQQQSKGTTHKVDVSQPGWRAAHTLAKKDTQMSKRITPWTQRRLWEEECKKPNRGWGMKSRALQSWNTPSSPSTPWLTPECLPYATLPQPALTTGLLLQARYML